MLRRLTFLPIIYSGICCCLLSINAKGQTPLTSETFTVKEGLSENVVHSLFQDKKGFLWIGTHEGLNRYDGYEFKKFLHDKDDSTSLPNSPIEAIYEDDNGNLLIRTTAGFTRMNMQTGKFGSIREPLPDHTCLTDRIPGSKVSSLGIDPFWIYNKNSVCLSPAQMKFFSDQDGLSFYYDSFKRLWILKTDKLLVIDETGNADRKSVV